MKFRRGLLLSLPGAVLLAAVVQLASFSPTQPAHGDSMAATYAHGALRVSIPFDAVRPGAGQLVVEVLDPEDAVAGHTSSNLQVEAGPGWWEQELRLSKALAPADLVWHRLRYQFTYQHEDAPALSGIVSISTILRTPVVHVLGQQSYLSGAAAAVRVIVTDSAGELISGAGSVRIELLGPGLLGRAVYSGPLNRHGTTEAQFHFPDGIEGNYSLRYTVDTAIGPADFTQGIRLENKVSILLTTEKPIYQPSQTIHVRALALDRSNHQASAGRKLTFELEDSRGNKVFRKITGTDTYGIASTEFGLADEVNLGTYHLRALMDGSEGGAGNTAEIALQVERYVLPKFKVAVDLAGKDAKAKRGYRPGDHVTGTVRANYFFGKPVGRAEITVKASAMDVAVFDAGTSRGTTDGDGAFQFDILLPSFLAGRPLSQGAARVLIEATVKDNAGHSETRGEPIAVSESPLLILAVPEGGTLIPGLDNQVFVLTSYPDGTPAQAEVRVRAPGNDERSAHTDAGGVAVVAVHGGDGSTALQIDAVDKEGNHAASSVVLQVRSGADQILLRTDRAVYRAGEQMRLQVFSTRASGTAYVDVVKDGQTVATRDMDIVNGRAELSLAATPELAGTLEFNAYLFGRDAVPVGDRRLVFVQPADELRIETALDSAVYRPGGEARIGFRVTNRRGEGVQAAVGVQIVDEAVFALAEKQPGFAKVFFYLEQEAMKPRYEIHSIGLPEAISSPETAQSGQRDRAARALFSATELVNTNKADLKFGGGVPQEKQAKYAAWYWRRFQTQVSRLADLMTRTGEQPETFDVSGLVVRVPLVDRSLLRDAWGNELRFETRRRNRNTSLLQVRSAGPDGQFNTADDLIAPLRFIERDSPEQHGSGNVTIEIEHARGPFNGMAEFTGRVTDATGAVIPGATIEARETVRGDVSRTTTDAEGRFSLVAVAGSYEIQASRPGFQNAVRKLTLSARDRAVLSVVLNVGKTNMDVEVISEGSAAVQADSVAVSTMLNQYMAGNFTLSGRDAGELMKAMPGMDTRAKPATAPAAETHVRSWFPEALYINPEIITDGHGRASVTVPIADSITTWRMAMLASTAKGALGSGTSSLKVFQDFFTDLDLPVTLTQGDQVSIPVAVYNYSGSRGDVSLRLQPDNWFSFVADTPDKRLTVDTDRVGGSQFTIEAKRIGKFKLTLTARMSGPAGRADVVVREIEVVPNGREQSMVFNGRLDSTVQHQVNFPAASIPDASTIFVRLYPGPLSQVIEGMDSLLHMPYGCFEQTSSSTYPNVLALDYMKRTKKLTPEVHAKAEGYIAMGYQRLLTFEVPGGGFSWFGNAPANKILTAYGLMEFSDMSKVYDIDTHVIERTQQWLANQQRPDGSWEPDTSFINEGATNRYNSDVLRITAYLAWSLENTGYRGPAIEKAKQFIETALGAGSSAKPDSYTLAVLANFAADYAKDRTFTSQAMQLLLDARTEQGDKVWWKAEETGMYATGASAMVETTGLAVQALLKWGERADIAQKAMSYIAAQKDAAGTWGTTQATIMALRALLLATEKGSASAQGAVEVMLNGKSAARLDLTRENNDLLHQFVFKDVNAQSANSVELRFTGEGNLAYQVAGRYFLPWDKKPAREALSIDVTYDRTHLEQDEIATATASVRNNLRQTANMVMLDLGIPPGFELLSEDLQSYREKSAGRKGGRLEKFSLTATQAILYFDSIAPRDGFALSYRLRAKYPMHARTFASRVYEYYDPEVSSIARPEQLEVHKR